MNNSVLQRESAHWMAYLELIKPKILAMIVFIVVIGMCLATPCLVPLHIMVFGNLGIVLCAASAAVINHVVDRQIDIVMARTHKRPVATGRIEPIQAILFAGTLGILGMCILIFMVNAFTAWLTLASLIGYAVIYTMMLKRATPQNIVIGGLAGAAPPLLGWTAVTGQFDSHALLLVLIIFAWTPPHFWALAIHRKAEYAKANIPMLPVTHGEAYTKLHILLYTVIMLIASILPFLTGMSGIIYLIGVVILGVRFLYWSIALLRESRTHAAVKTFRFSITYLILLFVILLVDHYSFYMWL